MDQFEIPNQAGIINGIHLISMSACDFFARNNSLLLFQLHEGTVWEFLTIQPNSGLLSWNEKKKTATVRATISGLKENRIEQLRKKLNDEFLLKITDMNGQSWLLPYSKITKLTATTGRNIKDIASIEIEFKNEATNFLIPFS